MINYLIITILIMLLNYCYNFELFLYYFVLLFDCNLRGVQLARSMIVSIIKLIFIKIIKRFTEKSNLL